MTTKELIGQIVIQSPERWEFIVSKLTNDEYYAVAQHCVNNIAARNKVNEELGLRDDEQIDEERAIEDCRIILTREATRRMWRAISKDQANDLLRSMQAIGAVSVTMPGGIEYTPRQIVDTWRGCNGGHAE